MIIEQAEFREVSICLFQDLLVFLGAAAFAVDPIGPIDEPFVELRARAF